MSEILDSAWEVEDALLKSGALILEAAIRNEFKNGLPKMWEGKPFSALKLMFERDVARGDQSIASESMEITPLWHEDAEGFLQDGDLIKHYGVERLQANQALAEAAGRTVLTRETDVADILKIAPVDVSFGWRPIVKSQDYDIFSQAKDLSLRFNAYGGAEGAPDMRLLISAKLFAEDIYEYTQSPHFILPLTEHLQLAATSGPVDESIYHHFQPAMRVDLPLNGYEGKGFLQHYAEAMADGRQQALIRLSKAHALPRNEFTQRLVDRAEKDVADYDAAVKRAQQFLL